MEELEAKRWEARRSEAPVFRPVDRRTAYGRDRARVIHSAAFRRLQAKTQVLGIGEGDFHRTRLTHSMEVAQIASGIVLELQSKCEHKPEWLEWLPGADLIEAIGLAHDFGHPPFGHGGEAALNYSMSEHGGFEGNGQTLRLLARLEAHTQGHGLDLTRRTLLGVLKYPVAYARVVRTQLAPKPETHTAVRSADWKPPKCYMSTEADVVAWIAEPFSPQDRDYFASLTREPTKSEHGKSAKHALDTAIMELADDIAYGVHDFEDAVSLRLVQRQDWDNTVAAVDKGWAEHQELEKRGRELFDGTSHERKRAIGGLVNLMITNVNIGETGRGADHPLLRLQPTLEEPARVLLEGLRNVVVSNVIRTQQVQTLEYRGQQIVIQLFDALWSDPGRLLSENFVKEYKAQTTEGLRARVVCDYIAGMTDEYATRMYERLFVPRRGHSSDWL